MKETLKKISRGVPSILGVLLFFYLLFNYLQMIGLSAWIPEGNSRDLASKITIFPIRNETAIAKEIYLLTNEVRAEEGMPSLIYDQTLSEFSKDWSNKLMDDFELKHSDYAKNYNLGENVGEVPISVIPIFVWVDECVFTITDHQVAKCHVNGWRSSPGHYRNLISGQYSSLGIGVSCNILECKATQMFG